MFRPEAHYETFVFEICGILLQNGSRIACGDEFRTADPECAQLVGGLLEVGFEGGKVSFGIVAKEGISSYASGSSYDALHALYGQECAGIFRHECWASGFEKPRAKFIFKRRRGVRIGVKSKAQSLGEVALTHESAGEIAFDLFKIELHRTALRAKIGIQFPAHPLRVGIGLAAHPLKLLRRSAAQYWRAGQSLAAQIDTARIARIVNP